MSVRRYSWMDDLSLFWLVVIIALCAAVMGAVVLGEAWLLQAVLHGFGHQVEFWPCVGAVVLVDLLLGSRGRS